MSDRTLFSKQPLIGEGTGQVQSLRSYVQRLALAHSLKPRKLLHVLSCHYPDLPMTGAAMALAGDGNMHTGGGGMTRLRQALERATGANLVSATLEPFVPAFSMHGSCGPGAMRYCPICVREDPDLPYGRLLWQLDFASACPRHGVKLRAHTACGAPSADKLPIQHRPCADGVCPLCGSIGFRCIEQHPELAAHGDIEIAREAERLLAYVGRSGVAFCPELLRAGLLKVVDARWGGSPVRAAEGTGLSRSSVWTWINKDAKTSLPIFILFCLRSRADVVAASQGEFQPAESPHTVTASFRRSYRRSGLSTETLKQLLIDASKSEKPPTVYSFARQLGIHVDAPRLRAPEEARLLAAAHTRYKEVRQHEQFERYVQQFLQAAAELSRTGRAVHRKSVQERSGIPTFSRGARRLALDQALAEHGVAPAAKAPPPGDEPASRISLLLQELQAEVFGPAQAKEQRV
jgi:hypothetical protein